MSPIHGSLPESFEELVTQEDKRRGADSPDLLGQPDNFFPDLQRWLMEAEQALKPGEEQPRKALALAREADRRFRHLIDQEDDGTLPQVQIELKAMLEKLDAEKTW